mgnify:CR=1 FL=1
MYDDNNNGHAGSGLIPNSVLFNKKSNAKRGSNCPLAGKEAEIDYKNLGLLLQFTSENGRILPSRITNVVSAKSQRKLKRAIKVARQLALLPYAASV